MCVVVIVVYRFHAFKFRIPSSLYCEQGLNPQGVEVMRLDIQMRGKRVEISQGINGRYRDEYELYFLGFFFN